MVIPPVSKNPLYLLQGNAQISARAPGKAANLPRLLIWTPELRKTITEACGPPRELFSWRHQWPNRLSLLGKRQLQRAHLYSNSFTSEQFTQWLARSGGNRSPEPRRRSLLPASPAVHLPMHHFNSCLDLSTGSPSCFPHDAFSQGRAQGLNTFHT